MSDTTHDAIYAELSNKIGPVLEPQMMALTAAIGRAMAVIIQEIAVMAKGMSGDDMTLQQFGELLSGELEQTPPWEEEDADVDAGPSDNSDS